MLPSSERLTRAQCSLLLIDPQIRVVFNRIGTLKYRYNTTNKGLSVVTGSKQQKSAVRRNTIRRQLYAIFTEYYKNTARVPVTGMLYVSKQVYDLSFEELRSLFNDLMAKTQKNA